MEALRQALACSGNDAGAAGKGGGGTFMAGRPRRRRLISAGTAIREFTLDANRGHAARIECGNGRRAPAVVSEPRPALSHLQKEERCGAGTEGDKKSAPP